MLSVATRPHELRRARRRRPRCCGATAGRRRCSIATRCGPQVASPTYLGAVRQRTGVALVDPGALALGLRRAALALGVRLYERTPVTRADGAGAVAHPDGLVRAAGCCSPPARTRLSPGAIRRVVAPVYDYVLVTEPLTAAQRRAVGWARRAGDRGPREPLPLLPADARRPHPVRRLRGGLPVRQPRRRRAAQPPPAHPPRCSPAICSRRSRLSRGSPSPMRGAARSTPAAGSASRSGAPSAAGRSTRSATPAWASAPAASAPGWRSTCSTAPTTSGRA